MTDLGIAGVGDATLIASGGSALVYRAMSGTGEPLAVKVLRGIRGSEVTRRFEREQSAATRLQGHPNIIRIHHNGVTAAGEPYLVMPLFAKGSLQDELDATAAFPLDQAIADVASAAETIDFAHSRGVLHRDIKPANLLRGDDGSVVVTDFGIARVVDAGITSATVGASTPLFAAPELLAENDASVQSEVYALGALLYALLAGTPAFSGSGNIWATMHRIQSEDPAPIPGVPEPTMTLVLQAMSKDPALRPSSAAVFASHLRLGTTAAGGQTLDMPTPHVLAVPPAPALDRPAPVVGSVDRRERATGKVLAVVAMLIAIGALAWFGWTQLIGRDSVSDSALQPPVDNSLPSPDTSGNPDPPQPTATAVPPTRLVSFSGDHFSAYLPEGWSVVSSDVDQGYGFRSSFVTSDIYLNVDTTPREQRPTGGDIAQSARDIAAGISSSSQVQTKEVDGLVMHSFTFKNRQGIDSIDIFFEVDGDGYAIVAGSASDPAAAFATAELVALSIRSNPDQ